MDDLILNVICVSVGLLIIGALGLGLIVFALSCIDI